MQLLRGFPWCHLNSALPPLFSIHLSACVPKHFCLMTSSLRFSQFRLLIDPLPLSPAPLCRLLIVQRVIMAWGTGSPAASSLSPRVNSHFSREGHHMASAHAERTSSYLVLTTPCQRDLSLAVKHACLWESANVIVWGFQRHYRSGMAKHQVHSFFLAQGKVRHVSIHRHKALEANWLETGRRSGQMTCTAQSGVRRTTAAGGWGIWMSKAE